jgi:hypothetical protein
MPIAITCPGCDKKLRVPDTSAGKKVRCPSCQKVVPVPKPEEDLVEPDDDLVEPDPEPPAKPKKTPEPKDDPESHVTAKPKKKRPPDDEAETGVTAKPKKKKADEGEGEGEYGFDEDDAEERRRRRRRRRREEEDDEIDDFRDRRPRRRELPHRGVAVLVLGILSIFGSCLCALLAFILASIALNMANEDLPKMERGLMDDSGRGMTVAGKACAYIGVLLGLLAIVANIVLMATGNFPGR